MQLRRAVAEDSPAVAAVVRAVYDEFGFTWDEPGYSPSSGALSTSSSWTSMHSA